MKIIFACFFICLFYANGIDGLPEHWNGEYEPGTADIITSIPTLDQMPEAEMFAGFLSPSDDPSNPKQMYYWLNRSQDPESKTLVLWLNGGPGCSSLIGLFTENGPLKFDPQTGNLSERKHSWNRFAHTLYIDAPVGTGYSYGDEDAILNDETTVTDIVGAIHDFLENHPRYIDFDIFLAGQSYAGVHLPLVAERLVENGDAWGTTLNFKGIILGNPLLYSELDQVTFPAFAYHHGLIAKDTYDFVELHDCNNITAFIQMTDMEIFMECDEKVTKLLEYQKQPGLIDQYDISRECWSEDQTLVEEILLGQDMYDEENATPEERQEMRENSTLLDLADKKSTCSSLDKTLLEKFLSDEDVQRAINAILSFRKDSQFHLCNKELRNTYEVSYFPDMRAQIQKLVTTHAKSVLLYYGDQDGVCNFLTGQEIVSGFGLEKTSSYNPYFITEMDGLVRKVAGFTQEYANRLKFATVKGAGHMAPRDRPEATFKLVSEWIASQRDN